MTDDVTLSAAVPYGKHFPSHKADTVIKLFKYILIEFGNAHSVKLNTIRNYHDSRNSSSIDIHLTMPRLRFGEWMIDSEALLYFIGLKALVCQA